MACYFIVSIDIDDPSMRPMYDQYIEKVKPIVEYFGVTYLVRTENVDRPFPGSWNPDRVIAIRFGNRETCDRCFASEEYRAIMALSTESVKASAIVVEGIEN